MNHARAGADEQRPGDAGSVISTTNGIAWTPEGSGTAYDLKAVACPSSSTCYAVGAGNTILQTTSAGSTWSWTPEYMQATPYYYGLDGHGSVVNVTDQSGTIQNQYRYDPYGNSLARTENASIANPWQYAGGYYEAESGLYLLGVRYYDPTVGLFLQVDPLATSGVSQYSYAGDEPCNDSDPTGMTTCYHFANGSCKPN